MSVQIALLQACVDRQQTLDIYKSIADMPANAERIVAINEIERQMHIRDENVIRAAMTYMHAFEHMVMMARSGDNDGTISLSGGQGSPSDPNGTGGGLPTEDCESSGHSTSPDQRPQSGDMSNNMVADGHTESEDAPTQSHEV